MTDKNSGIVFIHKQKGVTSFRTLDTIKKSTGMKKIGHTGTLDKFASGVLIVLTGKMTKLADYFSGMDKEYEAVFSFGTQTDTLDPEGSVINTCSVPSLQKITEVMNSFRGTILQIPPQYSAVHVSGKRAYQLALKGENAPVKPRKVTIHEFSLIDWKPPFLHVRVRCSKGTYIRALARDIGQECHSCAYVTSLVRTRVGQVSLEKTCSPEDFSPDKHIVTGKELFSYVPDIQIIDVDQKNMMLIKNGGMLKKSMFPSVIWKKNTAALFYQNVFLALIQTTNDILRYNFVSGDTF